jgi:molybdopterin/thiamine biosynthesis adenylyltransferase
MYDYFHIFEKNIGAISLEQQNKIRKSKIAVIGLGGIGSVALEILARTGVENFKIADGDRVELSNFNRQFFATTGSLGKRKVDIAKQRLKEINENIKVKIYGKIGEKNIKDVLKGSDAVVDGLDNLLSRIIVARACEDFGIPYIFGSADRKEGMSTVFMGKEFGFERLFRLSTEGKSIEGCKKFECRSCDYVLGIAPNMIGAFEALQTIKIILGEKVIKAPYVLFFDAFRKNPFYIRKLV